LLEVLSSHRTAVDEIALGDGSGLYPPLQAIERNTALLKRRIEQLKGVGWRTGINVGWTLGHWDDPNRSLPPPFQPTVGHDGRTSTSCPCPNSPEFRAYIRGKYELMARTNPDFIWVDDDLRASHHGPTYPCFCPICLGMFGPEQDRAALVKQLNAPANGELRRAWTEFCATSLETLCVEIASAVLEANSSVELGLMTIGYSHSTWAGYAISSWMRALRAVRGRPGHGYYTDQAPRRQLLDKAFDMGRQVRDYPPDVRIIQYELEDYPHIPLDKATRTVLNECTTALMMGCNGIAFTLFPFTEVMFGDYARVLAAVGSERPGWEALLESIVGLPLAGFWPADHRLLMANREVDATGWFWEQAAYGIQKPNETAEMGLPLTTDLNAACGILLAGRVAESFTVEELRGFLRKGVLMDRLALSVLWARGLGELTGVKPGEQFAGGITERLTNHELNGPYGSDRRDALVGPADGVCSLVPVAEGVEGLARLVRSDGADGGLCFSLYRNSLGGRVAVSAYSPWQRLGRTSTRHRLLAVADWLVDGHLPVLIEQAVRAAPLVRMTPNGNRFALVVLNTALDPTGPLTLRLRTKSLQISLISGNQAMPLPARRKGNETVVQLPSVPAWQTATLLGR
jgi:hypothetical protein